MNFDDILKDIGEFGPLQKRIYFLLCLPSLIVSAHLVVQVFLLGVPAHRCKIPVLPNDTYAVQSEGHADLIAAWVPPPSIAKKAYDECSLYVNGNEDISNATYTCAEWVYDNAVYTNTFAKKLNLVCGDAIKIANAQTVFFFGVLTGSIFFGQLSDIIGRRKVFYLALLLELATSLGLLGMTEYAGFCVLMFLLGSATLGVYMTSYVIGMELVGPNKRIWTGTISPLFLTTGQMFLILMVYLIRDWKYNLLAVSLPGCLFLPYYWLIPESCRWLISKKRNEEAIQILHKVAKTNGTTFNEKLIQELPPPAPQGRVWQLFSNKTLAGWTLIIFFNWFVCSMSYYGVVLNTGNLGGDIYLNFALLALVEYPGKLLNVVLTDRVGRKRLFVIYMFIGGLANIATIGPIVKGGDDFHYLLIGLAMVGKLCITAAFGVVYIMSAEIFPTVVRNAGMGSSSAIARVGSMIAPYIAKSADLIKGDVGKTIPLTLFGAAMFISGLMTLILPETVGKKLPESIDDVVKLKHPAQQEKVIVNGPENDGFQQKEDPDSTKL
ncbi:organic cation transporter protein-like [Dreissena polymorpha]|uniref:Major facilitator superfamily (MFS) profile domain-containing protein n=1 Tax=Dreissena polymorpha TaxID=45954 RepID=A0A9D4D3U8_DREPO|nr:organic cation transporter protein-like [Dreissena polymorpha]KAH3738631.1 hypothetical protein DPMN_045270 [Dreissena polymorpha]